MRDKIVDVYPMTNIEGFAPCHQDNLCTLAICKPAIRKKAGNLFIKNNGKIDYWIIGKAAKESQIQTNRLIYFMKVENVITFDEYYREMKYRDRADCIYKMKDIIKCNCKDPYCEHRLNCKSYDFVNDKAKRNFQCNGDHSPKTDIGPGQFVLLSKKFRYFGGKTNYDGELLLDNWSIPELFWKREGKNGPFRRQFDFREPNKIIDRLIMIKKDTKSRNCTIDEDY
jgi:hypothetical protein